MSALDQLEAAMNEVAAGTRIPYLGPGVSALSGNRAPGTPAELCAAIEGQVRAPRRASGNLWSVAQYVESRKFRATLDKIVRGAFSAGVSGSNPVHDWLARVRPPLIVDTWYDDGLMRALGKTGWGLVQGVSRNGEWIDIFTRTYDALGTEQDAPDPAWRTLLYKPHGVVSGDRSFLISDSDYVEVLTEIDIQRPIPAEVQTRRTGRPFLFVGCRFDDQMLRIFARQIAKRSGDGHVVVMPGPLTRMERRFIEDIGATWLDLSAEALSDQLLVPEG